jgi:hypothetical protein
MDLHEFHLIDHEPSMQEKFNVLNDDRSIWRGSLSQRVESSCRAIGFRRAKRRATFFSIRNYLLNRDE